MSKLDKRALILDAMQSLMSENQTYTASVSDIAQKAGIGKGSIYYYFKSKEEILDAVLERSYSQAIENSWSLVQTANLDSLSKMKKLFEMCVYPDILLHQKEMLNYLHLQDSLLLHQKFLTITIREFTPVLTDILIQAIEEGIVICEYPKQTAEIVISMLTLVLDPIILTCSTDEIPLRLKALSLLMERSMKIQKGSLSFLYENKVNEHP